MFGLLTTIVSVDRPAEEIDTGLKLLATVAGPITVNCAGVDGLPGETLPW